MLKVLLNTEILYVTMVKEARKKNISLTLQEPSSEFA